MSSLFFLFVVSRNVISINESCIVLWGKGIRWFWVSLLLFFVMPVLFGSYVCRALRLAVVFHPRAKRALPWLIPVSKERRVQKNVVHKARRVTLLVNTLFAG